MTSAHPPAPESSDSILSYYSNHSPHIQVARVSLPGFYLEQVLFPGQRWLFCSPAEAILEIYSSKSTGTPVCLEQIPCADLRVMDHQPHLVER